MLSVSRTNLSSANLSDRAFVQFVADTPVNSLISPLYTGVSSAPHRIARYGSAVDYQVDLFKAMNRSGEFSDAVLLLGYDSVAHNVYIKVDDFATAG